MNSPLGYFSRLLKVVDNWPHILWCGLRPQFKARYCALPVGDIAPYQWAILRASSGRNVAHWEAPSYEDFTFINISRDRSQNSKRLTIYNALYKFTEVNFSKLTHNNEFFRNDFVCIHYRLWKILSQIIECKMFARYDFLKINIPITISTVWWNYWVNCPTPILTLCVHLALSFGPAWIGSDRRRESSFGCRTFLLPWSGQQPGNK